MPYCFLLTRNAALLRVNLQLAYLESKLTCLGLSGTYPRSFPLTEGLSDRV